MSSEAALWHGYAVAKLHPNLPPPTCVTASEDLARPDYTSIKSSEYIDVPQVLDIKADMVIKMMSASEHGAPFLGAGISTGLNASCQDYASNAKGSIVQPTRHRLTYDFVNNIMRPTPAHRVLAYLINSGAWKIDDTLSQNHDFLLQRAGVPKAKVNELHGSWAPSEKEGNPVVPMSGNLRSDLFERLLVSERTADMCWSIGSSHSGLNCDRLPRSVGKRHRDHGKGQGTVILTIQKTPLDEFAAVRVFAKCDDFMMRIAQRMGFVDKIDFDTDYDYDTNRSIKRPVSHRAPALNPFIEHWTAKVKADAATASTATNTGDAATSKAVVSNNNNRAASAAAATSSDAAPPQQQSRPTADDQRLAIRIGNYHELVQRDDSNNSHRWTMFVSANKKGAIKKVVYVLHPTFNPPEVEVTTPSVNNKTGEEEFQMTRLGWGTFDVGVKVHLADGKTVLPAEHELSFASPCTSAVHFQK